MKIHKTIETIRNMKPSQYSDEMLLNWLSTLDGQIYEDVMAKYGAPAPFLPYTEQMMGRELLVPFPHDALYLIYLGAQIDYHNADYERYNNGMLLFNAQLQAFYNAYTRTHICKGAQIKGVKAL